MAIFDCKLFSKELFATVSVNVILPTPESGDFFFHTKTEYPKEGQKYQTLYLLHGISADYTDWARFSGIERYAQAKQLAVVMPGVDNSMYCNLPNGGNYYNFYTEELPMMMRAIFPLSSKRENNFVAGLSMGGFGSFKAALTKPQNYAAAASLSGGFTPRKAIQEGADIGGSKSPIDTNKWRKGAYGEHNEYYDPNKEDLYQLVENLLAAGTELPKLYQCCGTEDFLYEANIAFRDWAKGKGVDLFYEEGPGVHDWEFWDPYIRRVLDWLPLKNGFVD